jgi:ribosomal protein S19E (S16A)
MDRWKGRGGKSQRGEEPKREEQRRERVRRKKMQVREKAGSCETVRFSNDLWLRGVEK